MEILKKFIPIFIGFSIGSLIIITDLYIIGDGYNQSWISYLFFVPVILSLILQNINK